MLASDVCYRALMCVGLMLGRVSMWIHPLQGIHIEFARVNAYYDKAHYKSLIARENITRWNIARQTCGGARGQPVGEGSRPRAETTQLCSTTFIRGAVTCGAKSS